MSSGLHTKKLAKMLEISSFFVFKGNSVNRDDRASRAEPSFFCKIWRAEPSFLEGMASWAELFSPKARGKIEPSPAELRLWPNTTTYCEKCIYNLQIDGTMHWTSTRNGRHGSSKCGSRFNDRLELCQHESHLLHWCRYWIFWRASDRSQVVSNLQSFPGGF